MTAQPEVVALSKLLLLAAMTVAKEAFPGLVPVVEFVSPLATVCAIPELFVRIVKTHETIPFDFITPLNVEE